MVIFFFSLFFFWDPCELALSLPPSSFTPTLAAFGCFLSSMLNYCRFSFSPRLPPVSRNFQEQREKKLWIATLMNIVWGLWLWQSLELFPLLHLLLLLPPPAAAWSNNRDLHMRVKEWLKMTMRCTTLTSIHDVGIALSYSCWCIRPLVVNVNNIRKPA